MIQEHLNRFKHSIPTKINKDKYICNVQEAYEEFPTKDSISKKVFITIIKSFNLLLFHEIVSTGIGYKLPYGVGIFVAEKRKYKKIANRDWKTSEKINQWVRFKEGGRNGFTPKFRWLKKRMDGGKFIFTNIWRLRLKNDALKLLHYEAIENNNIVKYY